VLPLQALLVLALLSTTARWGWAYTAESPEVAEMVQKAVKYLETASSSGQPGGDALVGMAVLKSGEPASHPLVQRAIQSSRRQAAAVAANGISETCYNELICGMFLAEVDPKAYRYELETILEGTLRRQRENGCWGYLTSLSYDDTSQSQYGVLFLWAAHTHGLQVPVDAVERSLHWFMRTQDVGGGWTYQARDPGEAQRIRQAPPTHAMSAAGLGSVYICSHLLGFGDQMREEGRRASNLPSALRRVQSEEEIAMRSSPLKPVRTSLGAIRNITVHGDAWFANNLTYDIPKWTHYYMYGLERCMSFKELLDSKSEAEPHWYNLGVDYLRKTQAGDGSWLTRDKHGCGQDVDTAFAVLFLTRSTKKSIQAADKGVLIGGKTLPKDLSQIRLTAEGRVIDEKETPVIENLLSLLEREGGPQGDYIDGMPDELDLASDAGDRKQQIARLRRLARTGSFQARLTAVKTIGRDRSLDNVPTLIFALSDPDWRIQQAARNGLRFISRKIDGFGMPDKPDRQQWRAAQAKWKEWYLSIRPNGAFIE
jgi:hypothetical protein